MNEIDYALEGRLLFESVIHESWMTDEEYKEVLHACMTLENFSSEESFYNYLGDQLKIGVENGWTLEQQKVLIKNFLI